MKGIRTPPVNWRGKLRVLWHYGLPGTIILLVYWQRTWDQLLHGTTANAATLDN